MILLAPPSPRRRMLPLRRCARAPAVRAPSGRALGPSAFSDTPRHGRRLTLEPSTLRRRHAPRASASPSSRPSRRTTPAAAARRPHRCAAPGVAGPAAHPTRPPTRPGRPWHRLPVARLVSALAPPPRHGRRSRLRSSRRPRCVPSASASPSRRSRRRRRARSSRRRSRSEQTASVRARRRRRRLSTLRRRSGKPSARRASTKPPLRRAFAAFAALACWACCQEGVGLAVAPHCTAARNLDASAACLVDLDAGSM
eukprot:scaffold35915_cov69-Phaeocystis_antarctica.AAC.11